MMGEGDAGEMGEGMMGEMLDAFWDLAGWEPIRFASTEDGRMHVEYARENRGEDGEGGEIILVSLTSNEDDFSDASEIEIKFAMMDGDGPDDGPCNKRHCWTELEEGDDLLESLTGEAFLANFEGLAGFEDGGFGDSLEGYTPTKFEMDESGKYSVIFTEGEGNDAKEVTLSFNAPDGADLATIDFNDISDFSIDLFDELETPDFEDLDGFEGVEEGDL